MFSTTNPFTRASYITKINHVLSFLSSKILGGGEKINSKKLGRMVRKEKTQQQTLALDHSLIQQLLLTYPQVHQSPAD